MQNDFIRQFQNPSSAYRSAPFWAWNGQMDPDEVERQIRDMHAQGIGGFFMHSREGLETPYMGEEWFQCVHRAISMAKELDMKAWLYDEDRWPSGTAGGSIMEAGGDDSRYKGLTLQLTRTLPEDLSDVQAVYRVSAEGMECSGYERLSDPEQHRSVVLPEGEYYMIFRVEICFKSEWFNDETPPDNLNAASVRRFIKATHEKYLAHGGAEFGKTVPGIFTDEPGLADSHTHFQEDRAWLPWTYAFPDFFRQQRGYDIFDTLPVIFFNGKGQQKARHDFWWTVTELYDQAYFQQIGQWCQDNGLAFTGHLLQEDKLGLGTKVSGAIMPHYRHMTVPGIDMLTERCEETVTVKQCASVVNQLGKKWMLSETYGCTGWEFTFDGQKWVGDWQFVHGVNIRCQHLALYSITGCRKRDYPPVFNYQTPWWNKNRDIDDYFSRISLVMSEGDAVRDLLVLHPVSTAWSRLGCNPYGVPHRSRDRDLPAINQYGEEFNRFLAYLSGCHFDYDLGDEIILSQEGRVKDGRLEAGRISYSAAVIPPMDTILRSTLELLKAFLASGGKAVAVKPLPTMVEGVPEPALKELFEHPNVTVVEKETEVCAVLEGILPRRVSLTGPDGREIPKMLYLLKDCGEHYALFVVNNDRERGYPVTLSVSAAGKITQLDPLTGNTRERPSARPNRVELEEYFCGNDSRLYIIEKDAPMAVGKSDELTPARLEAGYLCAAAPRYSYTLDHPNALTLDKCRWRFLNSGWSEEMDVWQSQLQIRTALGMRPIQENGIAQRYKWINTPHPKDGVPVEFSFRFRVKEVPEERCFLVMEHAEDYEFSLNGLPLGGTPDGWYLDRGFAKTALPELVLGENTLVVSANYMNRMEFEDLYLIGGFGVDTNREICRLPDTLVTGDWCLQGLPHYCGTVTYHGEIPVPAGKDGRFFLSLEEVSATVAGITVNGTFVKDVFTASQKYVEITELVKPGENLRVDVEVVGSPRNLLGPFHQRIGKTMNTNCHSFRCTGDEYSPEYNLHPYGLMGLIRLHRI